MGDTMIHEITEESILRTIKEMVGFNTDYTPFDMSFKVLINSNLAILNRLGVGPEKGFRISGYDETWHDFLGDDPRFETVKEFLYLKVKMVFDTPGNSFTITALEKEIAELEWTIANTKIEGGVQNE